jgi:octopine/nopaline transport system permease protein
MTLSAFEIIGFGPNGWGRAMLLATAMTIALAVCGFLIGAVIGVVVARAKLSKSRIVLVAADLYTTVLRGVPDLLVIYLFYFGLSQLLGGAVTFWCSDGGFLLGLLKPSAMTPGLCGARGFIELPRFLIGILALGVISGAYQAETFRGAYSVLDRGQIEAARAIGMSPFLMFRRIIAPQVLGYAVPGLANIWQLTLKESALVSVIGLVEILRQSQMAANSTFKPFFFYVIAGCLYLAITAVSGYGFRRAEQHSLRGLRRA